MHEANRDLLIISKSITMANKVIMQYQLTCLHKILHNAESSLNFCTAHEVIDINRGKIITKSLLVQEAINLRGRKPFVFISCKN